MDFDKSRAASQKFHLLKAQNTSNNAKLLLRPSSDNVEASKTSLWIFMTTIKIIKTCRLSFLYVAVVFGAFHVQYFVLFTFRTTKRGVFCVVKL